MAVLIDTNIAIHLRDNDRHVVSRTRELESRLSVSIMSLVELEAGVFKVSHLVPYRRAALDALLAELTVLPLNNDVIAAYGHIIEQVGFSRTRVIDRLIAATAIVNDLTLITINVADFRDIPGLRLENWAAPAQ